jgi:hypothetical protein
VRIRNQRQKVLHSRRRAPPLRAHVRRVLRARRVRERGRGPSSSLSSSRCRYEHVNVPPRCDRGPSSSLSSSRCRYEHVNVPPRCDRVHDHVPSSSSSLRRARERGHPPRVRGHGRETSSSSSLHCRDRDHARASPTILSLAKTKTNKQTNKNLQTKENTHIHKLPFCSSSPHAGVRDLLPRARDLLRGHVCPSSSSCDHAHVRRDLPPPCLFPKSLTTRRPATDNRRSCPVFELFSLEHDHRYHCVRALSKHLNEPTKTQQQRKKTCLTVARVRVAFSSHEKHNSAQNVEPKTNPRSDHKIQTKSTLGHFRSNKLEKT